MGLEAKNDDAAARLIDAGRVLLARGDSRFPLTRLCAEAGVSLADFRQSFTSKAELMQQLLAAPSPSASAPAADPWLERRLRVFERALNALEERAEKNHRAQNLAIARLEERLSAMAAPVSRACLEQAVDAVSTPETQVVDEPGESAPETIASTNEHQIEIRPELLLAPLESVSAPKVDAAFLEPARRAAREFGIELEKPVPPRMPARWLVVAGLAALVLFACAGLTLVHAARAPRQETGVTHRMVATAALAQLTARADSGDAAAQSLLAFAYLRGTGGVARDDFAAARWARAAALQGDARAAYLMGSLAQSGAGTARDPKEAFDWFHRGAAAGNLKAMHNLAIAYAEGQGTAKDETAAASWFARAAARGYVDSAFDLAVLYERGAGVPQNVAEALRWYGAAAKAGDAAAAARARTLQAEAAL